MKKILVSVVTALTALASYAPAVIASEEVAMTAKSGSNESFFFIAIPIVVTVCMTLTSIAAAFAQSNALKKAIDGIARNPGASGNILTTMLVGLAMIESLAIYVLVIALILLFANPFIKYVVG